MQPTQPVNFSETLYRILPAVYRNRDNGDLKRYLDGCGALLDKVYQTLVQRLADNFPDNPPPGQSACQDWLLPYFAELVNARLVSPLVEGRRDEIANAVGWRQRKGTLAVVEQIAQAVAQTEVVVQEGWQRVAITPRLDQPLLPAVSYGYSGEPDPALRYRHPDLPAATVDFRCPSRAVATDPDHPAAQRITVDSVSQVWRQASRHGAPCFPDSYEDVSRRTVDLRTPDWRKGHYHPRRVLLYAPPPAGFFPPGLTTVNWDDPPSAAFLQAIEISQTAERVIYRNRSLDSDQFIPIKVRRVIELGKLPVHGVDPGIGVWRFEGLILDNTVQVHGGRLELRRCAARQVEAHSFGGQTPQLDARDCLFKTLQATPGLTQLEYCTVLEQTVAEILQASDCLFLGPLRKDLLGLLPPTQGCLRYSRIAPNQSIGSLAVHQINRAPVVLFSNKFGERGSGVLHPATAAAVRFGAEDGGELGAYHHVMYSLAMEAVLDKLKDFLPVGIEAALIQDPRLLATPPSL